MRFAVTALAIPCGLAAAASASAQAPWRTVNPSDDHGGFGMSMAVLPDLDGDGIRELLVGAPELDTAHPTSGRVVILSGASSAVLRTQDGGSADERFGHAAIGTGDLDLDGVEDYVIAAVTRDTATDDGAGAIDAFSAASGNLLWSVAGTRFAERFGDKIARLDDLDGDGRPETAVINSFQKVTIIDGLGATLWKLPLGTALADSVAALHDLDGDGVRDIAVGNMRYSGAVGAEGRVLLFSGASGASIGSFTGLAPNDTIGLALLSVPDVTGDGVAEIAVSGRAFVRWHTHDGMVQLRNGADFSAIWTTRGTKFSDHFGYRLDLLDDWSGDGVPELAATAWYGGFASNGAVRALDLATGVVRVEFDGTNDYSNGFEYDFGHSMAGADWDGDGIPDLAIGIPYWQDTPDGTVPTDASGIVRLYRGCPASASAYGSGWPGTLSTPALAINADPALGASVTLTADNSRGVATLGLLLFGGAPASVPLSSGATLLVAAPNGIVVSIPTNGWSLTNSIADDPALCFLDVYLQLLELDPGAVGGLSFTNGLQLRIGFDN